MIKLVDCVLATIFLFSGIFYGLFCGEYGKASFYILIALFFSIKSSNLNRR